MLLLPADPHCLCPVEEETTWGCRCSAAQAGTVCGKLQRKTDYTDSFLSGKPAKQKGRFSTSIRCVSLS